MERLYQLWYVDSKTRRRLQIWTILIAFAYGVFNSLILGRSERQVTWETLGVICFSTLAFSASYCYGINTSSSRLGDAFRNRNFLELGVASFIILLALSFASDRLHRVIWSLAVETQLRRSLSSPHRFDLENIRKVVAIMQAATADHVSINPGLVNVASKNFVDASNTNPDAWKAALALMSYRTTLNGESPVSLRPRTCIDVENVSGIAVHVSDSYLGNCTQVLDHSEWKNVLFENATIVYHGGPTALENVRFKNCQFSLDYTIPGQQLGQTLIASNSVTITLPG